MKHIPVLNISVITEQQFQEILSKAPLYSHTFEADKGSCNGSGCPFNYGDEWSEYGQNMGCLPDPHSVLKLRAVDGYTWACHADISKPCISGVKMLKELGLPYKVHQLYTTEDSWTP